MAISENFFGVITGAVLYLLLHRPGYGGGGGSDVGPGMDSSPTREKGNGNGALAEQQTARLAAAKEVWQTVPPIRERKPKPEIISQQQAMRIDAERKLIESANEAQRLTLRWVFKLNSLDESALKEIEGTIGRSHAPGDIPWDGELLNPLGQVTPLRWDDLWLWQQGYAARVADNDPRVKIETPVSTADTCSTVIIGLTAVLHTIVSDLINTVDYFRSLLPPEVEIKSGLTVVLPNKLKFVYSFLETKDYGTGLTTEAIDKRVVNLDIEGIANPQRWENLPDISEAALKNLLSLRWEKWMQSNGVEDIREGQIYRTQPHARARKEQAIREGRGYREYHGSPTGFEDFEYLEKYIKNMILRWRFYEAEPFTKLSDLPPEKQRALQKWWQDKNPDELAALGIDVKEDQFWVDYVAASRAIEYFRKSYAQDKAQLPALSSIISFLSQN